MLLPKPDIARRLLSLAAPIIGLNVLNVLALAIDTAMCGHLPEAERVLTALGFATQLVFLLMVAMMGLVVGAIAVVSRAFGGGDHERVNHVIAQATLLTGLIGLFVAGPGNLLAAPAISAMGASPEVVTTALEYLRPLLLGTVFQYWAMLFAAVLRGVGNTRLPFMVALAATALNVFLNYGLILGHWGMPALGIQGAAIGTVTSQGFSALVLALMIRRGVIEGLRLPWWPGRVDRALITQLFRVGAPAALDMVILNAAFLSTVGMLGRIDEVTVAAHGMGLRIQALAFVPGLSVSQATAALVGQALGGGRIDEAKEVVRASVGLTSAIMSGLALTIGVFAGPIVGIFDIEAGTDLFGYSVLWMELLAYGMPVVGVYVAYVGMLQGAGSTRTSLKINIFATLLIQIPLAWVLGFPLGFGAGGVWASFPIAFAIKAVLGFVVYRRGAWARVGADA